MSRLPTALLAAALLVAAACSDDDATGAADAAGADATFDAPDAAPDAGPDTLDPMPELAGCGLNGEPFPTRPTVTAAATLPPLRVEGPDVVDDTGALVALRGVNFGTWLMMESWMAGIGLRTEGELLGMIPDKAAEHGVADLIADARERTVLAWEIEVISHWDLVQQWRADSYAAATPALVPGLDAFWAWFDSEPWVFEERSLWRWLAGRFGWTRAQQLRAAWHDSYITELDFERLAGLGLNLVRLPIWYEALETDWAGDVRFRPEGWARLDQAARWARKHGVYLMLDLHGAPGGQNPSWHQGQESGGHLWTNPDCKAKTARLWAALASYFAGDPHVAVYNLLNEPKIIAPATYALAGVEAPQTLMSWAEVHDALYDAIRAHDADTIVMGEDGYNPASALASPSELGWDNAMFSVHFYPDADTPEEYATRILAALDEVAAWYGRFDVPLFVGEFNAADATPAPAEAARGMDLVLAELNARGIHWAPWTWKFWTDTASWGLYHPEAPARIDVRDAGFEAIEAAFRAQRSSAFVAHPAYEAVLEARAADPVAAMDAGPAGAP